MQEELKVKLADARECYRNASEEGKAAMEKLFGSEVFAFYYRDIKSYEDACEYLGISTDLPVTSLFTEYCEEALEQSAAVYKLIVICKALNNGQQYDKNGTTWYPYYYFYTKIELERMGEKERKEKGIQLLSACSAGYARHAGVRAGNVSYRSANTHADYGFPLYVNSEEKALYLDEQFRSLIYQCYGIKVRDE